MDNIIFSICKYQTVSDSYLQKQMIIPVALNEPIFGQNNYYIGSILRWVVEDWRKTNLEKTTLINHNLRFGSFGISNPVLHKNLILVL